MKNEEKYSFKILVEPTLDYELILGFNDGLALVRKTFDDHKIGFIDKTGSVVIPIELDDGVLMPLRMQYIFREGLSAVLKDDKCGFMDKSGKIVIPFEYDRVYWFSEGLAAVQKDGRCGFINKANELIIPFEYEYAACFSEGLAVVLKDGKYGYIDKTGAAVIPCELEYDLADEFNEGFARVMTGRAEVNIAPKSENESNEEWSRRVSAAHEEAWKHQKCGFIDKTGKIVVPLEYRGTHGFREGLANAVKDGKWRYIDKTGKTVLEVDYDYVELFSEGLAWVGKNNKWGVIDKTGELVIPLEYDAYDFGVRFKDGFSSAIKYGDVVKGKRGVIDKNGKMVVPFEYDSIALYERLAVVKKEGKWGIFAIEK